MNIRNVSSRPGAWIPKNRCIVPGDLVPRIADTKPRKTHNWFALNADRTLFAFAGLWARLCGARGPKSAPIRGEH